MAANMDFREFCDVAEQRLTVADREMLKSVTGAIWDDGSTLFDWVVAWGWDVRWIISQLDCSLSDPNPDIWEYGHLLGSLYHRDRLERAMTRVDDLVPEDVLDRVRDVLDDFDSEYLNMTVEDGDDLLTLVGEVRRLRAGWWWHRIPARGPIRQDLDRFALTPSYYIARLERPFLVGEITELNTVTDDASGNGESFLLQLLAVWGARVRLADLRVAKGSAAANWRGPPIMDWWAATLSTRDRVEALLPHVPRHLLGRIKELLVRIDEQYKAATMEDVEGVLVTAAEVEPEQLGWWWRRLPAGGFDRFVSGQARLADR